MSLVIATKLMLLKELLTSLEDDLVLSKQRILVKVGSLGVRYGHRFRIKVEGDGILMNDLAKLFFFATNKKIGDFFVAYDIE